jgi:hypothetical protein
MVRPSGLFTDVQFHVPKNIDIAERSGFTSGTGVGLADLTGRAQTAASPMIKVNTSILKRMRYSTKTRSRHTHSVPARERLFLVLIDFG